MSHGIPTVLQAYLERILDTTVRRFVSYYEPTSTGCWVWIAGKNKGGYGRFSVGHEDVLAHRFSYELYKGNIPDEMVIDHLCRTPSCVNPDHLEAVSQKENMRRGEMYQRGRDYRTSISKCPKGHSYDKSNTYHRPDGGRDCRSCMRSRTQQYRRQMAGGK